MLVVTNVVIVSSDDDNPYMSSIAFVRGVIWAALGVVGVGDAGTWGPPLATGAGANGRGVGAVGAAIGAAVGATGVGGGGATSFTLTGLKFSSPSMASKIPPPPSLSKSATG